MKFMEMSPRLKPNSSSATRTWVIVGLLALLGAVYVFLRSVGLDQSLWEDEIYTAQHYVGHGLGRIFDPDRYISNNHPLFSIVASGLVGLFGDSEISLRIGSVIPATAAAAVMTMWLWKRFGRFASLAFAFLVTLSPLHFEQFRQARGWGLALLGTTIVLVASLEMQDSETIKIDHLAWFVAGSLIGIWTIYALVLPLAVHGILLLASRRERKLLSLAAVSIVVSSLAFYWPLRSAIVDPAGARSGASAASRDGFITFGNVFVEPLNRLVTPLFELAFPTPFAVVISAMLVLGGIVMLLRERRWSTILHLVLPVAVVFLAFAIRETAIWDRYVSYFLVYILALVALGLAQLWSSVSKPLGQAAVAGVMLLLGLMISIGFGHYASPIISVPHENFKGAAAVIESAAPLEGAFIHSHAFEFTYNLETVTLDRLPIDEFVARSCTQEGPAVFIDYTRRRPPTDTTCLEERGVLVEIPQRKDPAIDVWLVP